LSSVTFTEVMVNTDLWGNDAADPSGRAV